MVHKKSIKNILMVGALLLNNQFSSQKSSVEGREKPATNV
jgi:hypothetical protein